jgi:alkylhydroperoxidase family enzyme
MERSEHGLLPLGPITAPTGLMARLLYAIARRRYGAVPIAFCVVYARAPWLFALGACALGLMRVAVSLPTSLCMLVQAGVASAAGCTFCHDLQLAEAMRERLPPAVFAALADPLSAAELTARQGAALAYARELGRLGQPSDATMAALVEHFSEREVVEIVWVGAVERYFNALALPLRLGHDGLADRARASRPLGSSPTGA